MTVALLVPHAGPTNMKGSNPHLFCTSLSYKRRYFNPDLERAGGGPRCFKCGLAGHLARDCPNPSAAKPCHVCASLEHTPWDCPRALCFKCRQPGHKARDCPGFVRGAGRAPGAACFRCGRADCRGADDAPYTRAGGGCRHHYLLDDIRNTRCATCGRCGHLSCAPAPMTSVQPTCYFCAGDPVGLGRGGRWGGAGWGLDIYVIGTLTAMLGAPGICA